MAQSVHRDDPRMFQPRGDPRLAEEPLPALPSGMGTRSSRNFTATSRGRSCWRALKMTPSPPPGVQVKTTQLQGDCGRLRRRWRAWLLTSPGIGTITRSACLHTLPFSECVDLRLELIGEFRAVPAKGRRVHLLSALGTLFPEQEQFAQ